MDEAKKKEILNAFLSFFKETFAMHHLERTNKLRKLKVFTYNPFLFEYLSNFLTGNSDAKSLAKSLIYPRALGTSPSTIFGQNMQNAAPNILKSVIGSTTSGIDIDFIDQLDGRKKYCQVKSGPTTINKDDVTTINSHFEGVRNLARTNNLQVNIDDLIVGVLYGTPKQLSANYKKVSRIYPVIVGKDFWHRLTGDENFYSSLIVTAGTAAKEINGAKYLEKVIDDLASDIQTNFIDKVLEKESN